MYKTSLSQFLAKNPFSHPLTLGFFYREKMRAIHHIAPNRPLQNILEVGGGESGLTALLYPKARITNLDLNPLYTYAPCNQQKRVRFVCGDATALPFKSCFFDAVTLFDLLEHVPDHKKAIAIFFPPVPVFSHAFSFSRFSPRLRRGICAVFSPITCLGYVLHKPAN